MSLRQDPAVTAQFAQVIAEYTVPIQQAGLPLGLLDPRDASTPDAHRRALVAQLQRSLPASVPVTVRGSLSPQAPADVLAKTERKVKEAVLAAAHESPVLRSVIVRDRTGREEITFYGRKRGPGGWMEQFAAIPLEMKRCGNTVY